MDWFILDEKACLSAGTLLAWMHKIERDLAASTEIFAIDLPDQPMDCQTANDS
ncbi:MAG TPA: hypothetical protein VGS04_07390 [Nitrososphaerales archaeon]|nr:hypothetical protein [Nitrososphaerales archaeon]